MLRETTSRGLSGLVCPSRTSERGGEGGEIHLSPSFWYTTAHGTFFLSFSVKCDIFWLFRAHGGNFLSFKQKRQKNATMGPARHNHAMMGPAQHFTTICSHGVLPVSLTP